MKKTSGVRSGFFVLFGRPGALYAASLFVLYYVCRAAVASMVASSPNKH
jgi:hypothetical protein